jgi:hypothetical protein
MEKRVIIIIGLPGSGKTEYAIRNFPHHILFDDFVADYYTGDVSAALIDDKPVCLTDPRLCIPHIFDEYIDTIENYVDRADIQLVLFENNPIACKLNKIRVEIDIFSKMYDLTHYKRWAHTILSVYQD